RIDRIKHTLAPRFAVDFDDPASIKNGVPDLRVQDAWKFDADVQQIAASPAILDLLGKLYGRRAFPFQTLNFPVGTEQALHSDSIHFSSIPERFMCGVWLAFEDVSLEAGPLLYLPGSHKWPILSNAAIGRRGFENRAASAQLPFQRAWDALTATSDLAHERFAARKGQALIWAANLLHGGDRQIDPTQTRWSQVTHYYFENCAYYTPAFSDEMLGRLDLRKITNIATGAIEPNLYLGEEVQRPAADGGPRRSKRRWPSLFKRGFNLAELPEDFDPESYRSLNDDVAASGTDPARHYLRHGRFEGRRYRRP
ncbi:MAG: phytanoyl-CoA dioxygenase family protein, partial [Sphingomicrobium sp.]